jgi:hypothetical protein
VPSKDPSGAFVKSAIRRQPPVQIYHAGFRGKDDADLQAGAPARAELIFPGFALAFTCMHKAQFGDNPHYGHETRTPHRIVARHDIIEARLQSTSVIEVAEVGSGSRGNVRSNVEGSKMETFTDGHVATSPEDSAAQA